MNDISGGMGTGYFTPYSRSQKKYYKVFAGLERKARKKEGVQWEIKSPYKTDGSRPYRVSDSQLRYATNYNEKSKGFQHTNSIIHKHFTCL